MTANAKSRSVSNASREPSADTIGDNQSVEFFDAQFRRQVREHEYSLNPFEAVTIEYLQGTILDLASGLGDLSLEAGRMGHQVLAVDANQAAVARINAGARREGVTVNAIQANIARWQFDRTFDTIIAVERTMSRVSRSRFRCLIKALTFRFR